jgi:two-component system OmpR family sensor kinase
MKTGLYAFLRNTSVAARLILGLTLGTTVMWCGAVGFSSYASYRELNTAFDRALQEVARSLLPIASEFTQEHEAEDATVLSQVIAGSGDHLSYQVRNASGRVVLRANDAPLLPYTSSIRAGFSDAGNYRLYTESDPGGNLTVTVAENTHERWASVAKGAQAMLWPLAVLIPLNIVVIRLFVRGALQPVFRLSAEISTRSGSNLAALDISDQPRELRPIAESVSRLIERLRSTLDTERAFTANSAHELRTPIAGALAQTQRLLVESTDVSSLHRARELEKALKGLSGLAGKLLELSRMDAGLARSNQVNDLLPVLDVVIDDWTRRVVAPQSLNYDKRGVRSLRARLDLDAFAIAMRNLLENAVLHGLPTGSIEVQVHAEGTVVVRNDGPVVPAELMPALKQRSIRGATRSTGNGLGLSIVETIMVDTGGTLELHSPIPGRDSGFEAVLRLPAA